MNRSNQGQPCVSILFLLLIGTGAIGIAFWLIDHGQQVPNFGVVTISVLAGLFFVSYVWTFLRYLRWRDQVRTGLISVPYHSDPNLAETIYGMIPGREYQVMKSFIDCYGNPFEQGERLRFLHRHFLPYHGGHTVVFEGRALYLQEDQNREILDHFSEYIALIQQ